MNKILLFIAASCFILFPNIKPSYSTTLSCPIKEDKNHEFYLMLNGFSRFDQLNFKTCTKPVSIQLLEIKPDSKIILDRSLNFTGLTLKPVDSFFSMLFLKLKGIDVSSTPTELGKFGKKLLFVIDESNLDFYFNGNKLIDQSYCNLMKFPWKQAIFMKSINTFIMRQSTVYPSQLLCPLLFYQVNFKLLNIEGISSSLLKKNIFGFHNLANYIANQNDDTYLEAKIFQLSMRVYRLDLNSVLLNHLVFVQINSLDIDGQLNSIQSDMFKSFKKLKIIRIRTQNVKGLFSRRNEWLNSLNFDVHVNPNDSYDIEMYAGKLLILVVFQTFASIDTYDYPDKDFCLFKHFPHERMVLPQLKPASKLSCSCTEQIGRAHV